MVRFDSFKHASFNSDSPTTLSVDTNLPKASTPCSLTYFNGGVSALFIEIGLNCHFVIVFTISFIDSLFFTPSIKNYRGEGKVFPLTAVISLLQIIFRSACLTTALTRTLCTAEGSSRPATTMPVSMAVSKNDACATTSFTPAVCTWCDAPSQSRQLRRCCTAVALLSRKTESQTVTTTGLQNYTWCSPSSHWLQKNYSGNIIFMLGTFRWADEKAKLYCIPPFRQPTCRPIDHLLPTTGFAYIIVQPILILAAVHCRKCFKNTSYR